MASCEQGRNAGGASMKMPKMNGNSAGSKGGSRNGVNQRHG